MLLAAAEPIADSRHLLMVAAGPRSPSEGRFAGAASYRQLSGPTSVEMADEVLQDSEYKSSMMNWGGRMQACRVIAAVFRVFQDFSAGPPSSRESCVT